MKIPQEYGGLGLTTVYYNRALALAGSWHSSLRRCFRRTSRSAFRSRSRVSARRSRSASTCRSSPARKSAHSCSPNRTRAVTRPGWSPPPSHDGGAAYELSGRKLWTTNGVIADRLVVMAVVPKPATDAERDRAGGAASPASSSTRTRPGSRVEHRNEFMGLRGIENGVTRSTRSRSRLRPPR